MDESQRHYAKWEKLHTLDTTYVMLWERQIYEDKKQMSDSLRVRESDFKGYGGIFQGERTVLHLSLVIP